MLKNATDEMHEEQKRAVKVLIVAEHASAVFGGEALIPLQYFKNLRSMDVDVHLLVHERTRSELEALFPHDLERLHFVADSSINIWCHKLGGLLPQRLSNFTFGAVSHFDTQIRQRRLAKSLVHAHRFDVVHEPIPVSPKLPSVMFGLSAPVLIGPMNGGMDYPENYNLAGPVERIVVSALRWTASFWNRLLPGKRQAAALLVANARSKSALPGNLRCKRIIHLPENGVDLELFRPAQPRAADGVLHIVYIGRLVDWKRIDLLLDACKRLLGTVSFKVDLIGDGPMRQTLEKKAAHDGILEHVRFHGRLAQTAVAELLDQADVMVLPSMYECGGAVVLEAMATGIPVIATKWGGPEDYVAADTGFLIPPGTPETFVAEVADALLKLADNPQMRAEMGAAGRRRVAALYDWRIKTRALLDIYIDLLGRHSTQPAR